jgi:hypothetical protein
VYSAEISRANPTCFVLMIDQSASMQDPLGGGSGRRKCEEVADAVNRLLSELAIKCAKEEGVRDYFHVAVIGYGCRSRAVGLHRVLSRSCLVRSGVGQQVSTPARRRCRHQLSPGWSPPPMTTVFDGSASHRMARREGSRRLSIGLQPR